MGFGIVLSSSLKVRQSLGLYVLVRPSAARFPCCLIPETRIAGVSRQQGLGQPGHFAKKGQEKKIMGSTADLMSKKQRNAFAKSINAAT